MTNREEHLLNRFEQILSNDQEFNEYVSDKLKELCLDFDPNGQLTEDQDQFVNVNTDLIKAQFLAKLVNWAT